MIEKKYTSFELVHCPESDDDVTCTSEAVFMFCPVFW
jgi:hypothetical protein